MAILRTEINGKVIMTYPDKMLDRTFLTSIDLITNDGLLYIDLKHSTGIEQAKRRHDAMVAKYQKQEPHACARCGRKDYLPTYSRVFEKWLCPTCYEFRLEACI